MALESKAPAETLAHRVAIEVRRELYGRGHNQAALARALGVTDVWVSERLSGRVQLTLNDLDRIAEALGVDVDELVRRARQSQPTLTYPPIRALADIPSQRHPVERPPARADARRPPPHPRRASSRP